MAILNQDTTIGGIEVYPFLQNGGGAGKKCSTIIIGTSLSGYTEDDVDYLCTGTNDHTIIRTAVNSLSTSGGKIIFLNGTYNLQGTGMPSSNIPLLSNITYEGMGSSTIFNVPTSDYPFPAFYSTTSIENIIIKNIQINSLGDTGSGIYFNPMDSNVYIKNVLIENCIINAKQAIASGRLTDECSNLIINNNTLISNITNTGGIIHLVGPISNLKIINNHIEACDGIIFEKNPISPYNSSRSSNTIISNNIFITNNDGLFLDTGSLLCDKLIISGNSINWGYLYINEGARYVTVSGNHIGGAQNHYSIEVNGSHVSITGNVVNGNYGASTIQFQNKSYFCMVIGNLLDSGIEGAPTTAGNLIYG